MNTDKIRYNGRDIDFQQWVDWKWQQRNSIQDESSLKTACGGWHDDISQRITHNLQNRKMRITPYYLKLILDTNHFSDLTQNPLWRQVVPFWSEEGSTGYDGMTDNWELDNEMKTSICQHKYDNRVILRMINTCNAYCQFCFEALRTLEMKSEKSGSSRDIFKQSLDYINTNKEIEEVIFSGGDPLMLSDEKLKEHISALRRSNPTILIRIHTRALTFNPYRITDQFIETLKNNQVNSVGVHVCHPAELSNDFKTAIKKIQSVVPIVFSNMPFLKGVNDDEKILHELFIELYRLGVKPYYLYHYMPFSPGASEYKASVKEGIAIMSKLKRRISNIAMPEYVLPHSKGKFTVPLINDADDFPRFENIDGKNYYRFTNWQGEHCFWEDL